MQADLEQIRESSKTQNSEVDSLKSDVNFYRQESAIYEQRNSKLSNKVDKIKKKKSEILAKYKPRDNMIDEEV